MKLNKYSVIAFGLSCAMLFAGCAFEGTKTNFKKNENNAYNAVYDSVKMPGTVVSNPAAVSKDANTLLSFVVISNGYMDEDTIDEGCNFYAVSNNNVAPDFYPVISDSPLQKTLKDLQVVTKAQGHSDTTISYAYDYVNWTFTIPNDYLAEQTTFTFVTYLVDTSSYTTDKLALKADAEELRETTKKYILNNDDNDECGEETDSIIAWYSISGAATPIVFVDENGDPADLNDYTFAPTFGFTTFYGYVNPTTDKTAVYRIVVGAPYYTKNGSPVYWENMESVINNMLTFKYRPLGEKKWQSQSVSVEYDTANKRYKWDSAPLAVGTQCYVVYEEDNDVTWDAAAEAFGGRAPRFGYGEDQENLFGLETSYYYSTEPSYIITDPTVATTFTAGSYRDYSTDPYVVDIHDAQSALVDYDFLNDGIIKISISTTAEAAGIRFGAIEDFEITNRKNGKCGAELDFELLEDKTISDTTGIKAVFLQLDNKYFDLGTKDTAVNPTHTSENVMIWIGPGVTISGSKTAQTTFGSLGADRDSYYLAMPGYVCIN